MKDTHLFDNRPSVKPTRLNMLPANPETSSEDRAVALGRFPSWLHRPMPKGSALWNTGKVLADNRLHTVCEEARCPNLLECWSRKTATFLILGKECTRACGFCDIDFSKKPQDVDPDEARRVGESVLELGLKHVVITMVARDDLPDGGARHLAETIYEVRRQSPHSTIEVLSSDFNGNSSSWDTVLEAKPEIYNHNIETVRALTPRVRHRATYDRTLALLAYVHAHKQNPSMRVKSGLMVGLGESDKEVYETLDDLKNSGCDIITIGQYLQPNRHKLLVKSFVTPEQFKNYEEYGYSIGVKKMYASPFVRSSYNANLAIE